MRQRTLRVLLVDDEISMIKVFTKRLEVAGYEVIAAADGEEALAKVASEHPDMVILDIMLPKLNGYEVCKKLKQDPATEHIPVLMFTAKSQPQEYVAGMLFGADAYLNKSCDPKDLLEQVRALLRKSA